MQNGQKRITKMKNGPKRIRKMHHKIQNETKQIKRKIDLVQYRLEQFKERQGLLEKRKTNRKMNYSKSQKLEKKNYEKRAKEGLIISFKIKKQFSATVTLIMTK